MSFDPVDPDFIADPYPTYAALRADGAPSLQKGSPLGETWPVARYADVVQVLRSPAEFSSSVMVLPGQEGGANTSLIGQDPPAHGRQRGIVNRGFTPRRIAALEAAIRARVQDLVAKFADRGEVELVRELASPLPVMVIAELVGLDAALHDDFKRWSDAMVVGTTGNTLSPEEVERALAEMRSHLNEAIEARRQSPGDDLISALVHAEEEEGVLNPEQVLNFVQLLVAAGSETTTNLIGNASWILATRDEIQERVRADLSLIPRLLEETLRWASPVQLVMRRTTREVSLGGAQLPADAFVFVLIGSANRDDERFDAADRFDLDRDPTGHVAFGLGTHFCLGASLARLQARLAMEALLTRLGKLELGAAQVETHGSFLVRGPRALPLKF